MIKNVVFLTAVLSTGVCFGALEYTFDSGVEGWTSAGGGAGPLTATLGVLGMDYVSPGINPFDPQLNSPAISLPAARNHWLVMEINLTAAPASGPAIFQLFFSLPSSGIGEPQSRTFLVTPNTGWQTVVLDLAPFTTPHVAWTGTINQLRLDPGSDSVPLVGYRCEIDRLAFTDDTDGDGINDDLEIFWFGDINQADAASDHDNNGISDAMEIGMGLNPLIDNGERLPVAALPAVAGGLLAAGLWGLRRMRKTAK